jgi:hypothetical protein
MGMPTDIKTTAIPDANILTKFTDYGVNMPDWLIDFIEREVRKRNVRGLTNNVITKLVISGEHPLVQLTAALLDATSGSIDISGFLPAVSVVEGDENEEPVTLGHGFSNILNIDQAWIDQYRIDFPDQEIALQDGQLTTQQLLEMETFLATLETGKQTVYAIIDGFFLQTNLMVGVWCQTVQERTIIGNLVRSILFDARKYLSAERGIKDIHYKTAKGLVNTNFGTILLGQETTMDFINYFHNITVTKDIPLDVLVDLTDDDAVTGYPGYYSGYHPEDNIVQYPPGEEIPGTERT